MYNLHSHPSDQEKYLYLQHKQRVLSIFSLLGFLGVVISSWRYFSTESILAIFYPALALSIVYFGVSIFIQGFGKAFAHGSHKDLINMWKPSDRHTVDIFLPTAGEDISIIRNTWEGVRDIRATYQGKVAVYSLDDGHDARVEELAKEFGFTYLKREDRHHFKKSGNLHHGYKNSQGEFVVIFDADFKPRADFLNELLPYFDQNPRLGIVQSPQYFDTHQGQTWLERAAGSVQEYFYRSVQQNRQAHGGAICVGTNAIYRRAALKDNDGPIRIEHSEDVHTGFDVGAKGWDLLYVPIILAKGVCPSDIRSFFRQQYRWCRGSMSLLRSKKFWARKISIQQRLCFFSGFLYYISTAVFSIVAPMIPLSLIFLFPEQARLLNYALLIPAFVYVSIVLPLWHHAPHRLEVFSVKFIYGWAHLVAIIDTLMNRGMAWHPTGSASKKMIRFTIFQAAVLLFVLPVAALWVGGGTWYMINWNVWDFLPITISGAIYVIVVLRVSYLVIEEYVKRAWGRVAIAVLFVLYFVGAWGIALTYGKVAPLQKEEEMNIVPVINTQEVVQEGESIEPMLEEVSEQVQEEEGDFEQEHTNTFVITVQEEDSLTHAIRRAVMQWSEETGEVLLPWEKIMIETKLVQARDMKKVREGDEIRIESRDIETIFAQLQYQSKEQVRTWMMYADRVW